MARLHFARFGPAINIVPVTYFSRMSLTDQQWADAWKLVGPSAEKNMTGTTKRGPLELWQVIAAAYLEGLHHGHGMATVQTDKRLGPVPMTAEEMGAVLAAGAQDRKAALMLTGDRRDEVARILEIVAKDGLDQPRDLDAALDAIEQAYLHTDNT